MLRSPLQLRPRVYAYGGHCTLRASGVQYRCKRALSPLIRAQRHTDVMKQARPVLTPNLM